MQRSVKFRSLVVGMFFLVLAAVGFWMWGGIHRAGATDSDNLRTVIVASSSETLPAQLVAWDCSQPTSNCQNGTNGTVLVWRLSGVAPKIPVVAKVLTDTNCTPDAAGISHCHNILQLPDGQRLEVRHDHNMQSDPCLTPGERVHVQRAI